MSSTFLWFINHIVKAERGWCYQSGRPSALSPSLSLSKSSSLSLILSLSHYLSFTLSIPISVTSKLTSCPFQTSNVIPSFLYIYTTCRISSRRMGFLLRRQGNRRSMKCWWITMSKCHGWTCRLSTRHCISVEPNCAAQCTDCFVYDCTYRYTLFFPGWVLSIFT